MSAAPRTLSLDCGGSGIKGCVLDEAGSMLCAPVRVPTPYPLPPQRFVSVLREVADGLPSADRITVGMPGMIRHGRVVTTPHYVTRRGPRSAVDPDLATAWSGFDARAALHVAFDRPVLVLNDAEVHGAGAISGEGLELVLTLGTGLGCALFDSGRLAPHLEMSQAPVRGGIPFDLYVGDRERRRLGNALWSRRVRRMLELLRPVFLWDRLHLGGGNAVHLTTAQMGRLGDDIRIVPNEIALVGGARAWSLEMG